MADGATAGELARGLGCIHDPAADASPQLQGRLGAAQPTGRLGRDAVLRDLRERLLPARAAGHARRRCDRYRREHRRVHARPGPALQDRHRARLRAGPSNLPHPAAERRGQRALVTRADLERGRGGRVGDAPAVARGRQHHGERAPVTAGGAGGGVRRDGRHAAGRRGADLWARRAAEDRLRRRRGGDSRDRGAALEAVEYLVAEYHPWLVPDVVSRMRRALSPAYEVVVADDRRCAGLLRARRIAAGARS